MIKHAYLDNREWTAKTLSFSLFPAQACNQTAERFKICSQVLTEKYIICCA